MELDELTDLMLARAGGGYEASVRMMLDCLPIISVELPAVALSAVEVATRHWIYQAVPQDQLEKARIECWNYLDGHSDESEINEAQSSALRAVICVLYADMPSDDPAELIDFFNQMLRKAFDGNDEEFMQKAIAIVDNIPSNQ